MISVNVRIKNAIDIKQSIETMFLVSPFAIMLVSIFNVPDTKWILSRLIPAVSLYCVFFYRDSVRKNWGNLRARPFYITSMLVFFYFGLASVFRGDNFGLPRTLLTCLAYILLVPWERLFPIAIKWIVVVAAMFCGINACYEFFILEVSRVGIATNPIPYALYCAVLALAMFYQLLTEKELLMRVLSGVGFVMTIVALILTDVRGVILFFPLVVGYLFLRLLLLSSRGYIITSIVLVVATFGTYFVFQDKIENRVQRTVSEFKSIEEGDLNTSIGARLSLWKFGGEIITNNFMLGVGDDNLVNGIKAIPNNVASKTIHLHNQLIDSFARYGFLGLIMLLTWICSPLIFISSGGKVGLKICPLQSSIVLIFLLAGISDVPFHHTHLVYLFTLFIGMTLSVTAITTSSSN